MNVLNKLPPSSSVGCFFASAKIMREDNERGRKKMRISRLLWTAIHGQRVTSMIKVFFSFVSSVCMSHIHLDYRTGPKSKTKHISAHNIGNHSTSNTTTLWYVVLGESLQKVLYHGDRKAFTRICLSPSSQTATSV